MIVGRVHVSALGSARVVVLDVVLYWSPSSPGSLAKWTGVQTFFGVCQTFSAGLSRRADLLGPISTSQGGGALSPRERAGTMDRRDGRS